MELFMATNNLTNLRFEVDVDEEKAYLEYRWYKKDLALMQTTYSISLLSLLLPIK